MGYFEKFSWYLPSSFSDNIAQCKFEQGDVIYPIKTKGEYWQKEIDEFEFLIQIKSPERTNSTNSDNELNLFKKNWSSVVKLEIIYPKDFSKNYILSTTQGKLLIFLNSNKLDILTNNKRYKAFTNSSEINYYKPIKINESNSVGWLNNVELKKHLNENQFGFSFIFDKSNSQHIIKKSEVLNIIQKYSNAKEILLPPEKYIIKREINEKLYFLPTIDIVLFCISKEYKQVFLKEIKDKFFKGIKNKFSINSHGLLIE